MATAAERKAARIAARKSKTTPPAEASLEKDMNAASQTIRDQAAKPEPIKSNGATVVIACKIPQGVILQNYEAVDGFEPVFGGGSRPIKSHQPVGPSVRINGCSRPLGSDPEAKRVIGGFALTFGVPKDFWDRWYAANQQLDMVKNGMIFAHESENKTVDQAKDMRTLKSGLEPLDTEGKKPDGTYRDPRMPAKVRKFDPNVDTTDMRGA